MQTDDSQLAPEDVRLLAKDEIVSQIQRLENLLSEANEAMKRIRKAVQILDGVQ